ncbi:hypothetical protein EDB80DRAFT_709301 [Ilyonectria destructans]|nr:hypothetical protein EDB80DRAFT_709301 [Ilyonectria destructans]
MADFQFPSLAVCMALVSLNPTRPSTDTTSKAHPCLSIIYFFSCRHNLQSRYTILHVGSVNAMHPAKWSDIRNCVGISSTK